MNTAIPTPPQLLTRAADIIGERGWNQGNYCDRDGRVCALGAVYLAAAEHMDLADADVLGMVEFVIDLEFGSTWERAIFRAETAIRMAVLVAGFTTVANWNDDPGRAQDEVVALLRRAAEAGERQ